MSPQSKNPHYHRFFEILLVIIIAGCAYLPNLTKASIYRDDWYYAMDRMISGPGVFQEMFSIDRPARGPLFEAYYQLFDVTPLPYHISSFIWRVLGGLAALYLFNLLWPNQKKMALFMALLFTLFPGYSRWLEGFENQPRILSSFLEVFSIALTIKAIQARQNTTQFLYWAISILFGWIYIALVDFSIGMEFFRLGAVFIITNHSFPDMNYFRKVTSTLKSWAFAALIPAGFLFWRLFIFHNERPTTDINLQLSFLVDSPFHVGLLWLIRLIQSTLNIGVLAWTMPTAQTLYNYQVSEILFGIFLSIISVLVFLGFEHITRKISSQETNSSEKYNNLNSLEAISIGLSGIAIGVMPVIMANRYATLGNYSHYALPASLAAAVLVGGFIFAIKQPSIRLFSISTLVLLAVLTQYTISLRITQEEAIVSNFWHQVVWRIPGIEPGTTLFVNYPSVDYGQDVDTVAGPANFLYFPQRTNKIPAVYPISALEQGDPSSKDIISDPLKSYTFRYRTHESEINYAKLLVISQPTEDSCVHILDSVMPMLSKADPYSISTVAQYSKLNRIILSATAPIPSKPIFGGEPPHEWCYYYQRADLAMQKGNWAEIQILGDEVIKQDLYPIDTIEWMPFLRAYASAGNVNKLEVIAKQFKKELFYRKQVCQVLTNPSINSHPTQPETLDRVKQIFCDD